MPAPAAPTSLTVLDRAQGAWYGNALGFGSYGTLLGDAILLGCSAVPGATTYVWTCDEFGTWTTSGPQTQLPPNLTPVHALHANGTGIAGHPEASGGTASNLKVLARNASGDSAEYIPGLTVATRTDANLLVSSPADASPPVPVSAAASGLTITVNYTYASARQTEYLLFAELYAAGTLVARQTVFALTSFGAGVFRFTAPENNTDYTVKLDCTCYNSATCATTIDVRHATEMAVHVGALTFAPSSLTVVAGEAFSVPLVSSDLAAVISPILLPAGVTITAKVTGQNQSIQGTLGLGSYEAMMTQTAGGTSLTESLPIVAVPAITAPVELTCWLNDKLLSLVSYDGSNPVQAWYITNAPPGVEIGSLAGMVGYGGSPGNVVAISGAPTVHGIFEAEVFVQVLVDGDPVLYSAPVRFVVSGDLFLGWFHDDPDHFELQVSLRDRQLHGYSLPAAGLALKRSNDERLYVIFRDGPLGSPTTLGRDLIADGFTALRLVIRPDGDYDAESYLDIGQDVPVTESIAGHDVFVFPFTVLGEAIDQAFAQLDQSPGSDQAEVSLAAMAELQWTRHGRTLRSLTLPAQITQDVSQ